MSLEGFLNGPNVDPIERAYAILALTRDAVLSIDEAQDALGIVEDTIKPVEKPVPGFKVGDYIRGTEAYDALPVGAVVASESSGVVVMRTETGFANNFGTTYGTGSHNAYRKIVHLP